MRMTKLEHACLLVEKDGTQLLIDPGSFTHLPPLQNVVSIVLTHEHADHADPEHLRAVLEANPQARILGPAGVAAALEPIAVEVANAGTTVNLGPFEVSFGGGVHAEIHRSIPRVDNLTVLVNGTLYHPGDSLDLPERQVEVLAAPVSGPWLKLGEVMDYVLNAPPARVVCIHEALASQPGQNLALARIADAAAEAGSELVALDPGENLEL